MAMVKRITVALAATQGLGVLALAAQPGNPRQSKGALPNL